MYTKSLVIGLSLCALFLASALANGDHDEQDFRDALKLRDREPKYFYKISVRNDRVDIRARATVISVGESTDFEEDEEEHNETGNGPVVSNPVLTSHEKFTEMRYRIDLHSSSGPKIHARYKVQGQENYEFKLFLKRMYEFTNRDEAGFQWKGTDQTVRVYGAPFWNFMPFVDVNPDSTTDRRFWAITQDGVFNISFHVNPSAAFFTDDDDQSNQQREMLDVGLNDIKFNITVDFDRLKEINFFSSPDSALAIQGVMQSTHNRRICDEEEMINNVQATCIHDIEGTPIGFVSWTNHLMCPNNVMVNLVTTSFAEDDSEGDMELPSEGHRASVIMWTIPNAATATGMCVWDPVFHATAYEETTAASNRPEMATALTVLALAASLWWFGVV